MDNLLKELEDARFKASACQMDEAKEHIEESLKLLSTGPETAVSVREAQTYVAEARFAAIRTESRQAIEALDRAMRALENPFKGCPSFE